MLFGVLSGGGQIDRQELRKYAQAEVLRYPHESLAPLIETPIFCLYGLAAEGIPNAWTCVPQSDDAVVWFFGLDRPNRGDLADIAALKSYGWNGTLKLSGGYLALRWNPIDQTLKIATDPLGLAFLFRAQTARGFVFSSDFGAVAQFCDELTIHQDNAMMETMFGYSPVDTTLFQQIERFPAASLTQLTPRGYSQLAKDKLIFGDRYSGKSDAEKFEAFDSCLAALTERQFRVRPEEITLSLSGGWDSRYALALLYQQGLQCSHYTFGLEGSEEVLKAESISARVGQTTTLFQPMEAPVESWRQAISLLGNAGIIQWFGWIESYFNLMRQEGSATIFGLLGDALSGKHLPSMDPGASKEEWVDAWVKSYTPDNLAQIASSPAVFNRAEELARDSFRSLANQAEIAVPYQSAQAIDLLGRQRLLGGSQPQLIARFMQPVVFLVDQGVIDYFNNLELGDLTDQRLYLAYARDRFPQLFQASDFTAPPRGLTGFARRVWRRLSQGPAPVLPRTIPRHQIVARNHSVLRQLIEDDPTGLSEFLDLSWLRNWLDDPDAEARKDEPLIWIMRAANLSILGQLSAKGLLNRVVRDGAPRLAG